MDIRETNRANQIAIEKEFIKGVKLISMVNLFLKLIFKVLKQMQLYKERKLQLTMKGLGLIHLKLHNFVLIDLH